MSEWFVHAMMMLGTCGAILAINMIVARQQLRRLLDRIERMQAEVDRAMADGYGGFGMHGCTFAEEPDDGEREPMTTDALRALCAGPVDVVRFNSEGGFRAGPLEN